MGDISQAVSDSLVRAGLGDQIHACSRAFQDAISYYTDPSAIYRPALSIDGDQWCALYGDNLQDGVAGFGDSPELAMRDFNKNWNAKLVRK